MITVGSGDGGCQAQGWVNVTARFAATYVQHVYNAMYRISDTPLYNSTVSN